MLQERLSDGVYGIIIISEWYCKEKIRKEAPEIVYQAPERLLNKSLSKNTNISGFRFKSQRSSHC